MRKVLLAALLVLLPEMGGAQSPQPAWTFNPSGAGLWTAPPTPFSFRAPVTFTDTVTLPADTTLSGGTFTGPVGIPPGSAAVPGLYFSGTAYGLYLLGGTNFGISVAGGRTFEVTSTILYSFLGSLYIGGSSEVKIHAEAANVTRFGSNTTTAAAQTIKGADSSGATITGGSLTLKGGNGQTGIANGGPLILSGGAPNSTGEPGAVAIADGGTRPTCAAEIRGSLWYDAGSAGVLDTLEVCRKDASNNYAWVGLF